MENLVMEFIKPEFLIVVALCYALGLFLRALSGVPNWVIPFALLVFAVMMAILLNGLILGAGFTAAAVFWGFIQGLLCAAVAVFLNQLYQQGKEKDPN